MGDDFKPFPHFSTNALHAGQEPEQWKSMAVVPPISLSTTFKHLEPGVHAVSKINFSYYHHKKRKKEKIETYMYHLTFVL